MLLVPNAVSKHRCPSSRMGPGRYTAANAIRSIDLPDRPVDTNPSIFLNDLFIRGQHPSIAGTLNEGKCFTPSRFFALMDEIMNVELAGNNDNQNKFKIGYGVESK